jgi:hypothetical protein
MLALLYLCHTLEEYHVLVDSLHFLLREALLLHKLVLKCLYSVL